MSASSNPEIEYSGVSHVGLVREDNQDSIRLPDESAVAERGPLYGLADGMGGYSYGKLASTVALEKFFETFYSIRSAPSLKDLRRGVESANLGVYQAAQNMGAGRMGTTLTAVNVSGNKLRLAHVGDSRAYLIRDGQATCLTQDHTTVGDLVRMKVLTPDKVRTHARRSILTRSVGLSMFVQPDLTELALCKADRIILCSDGVWAVIQDEEFAHLSAQTGNMHTLSQDLINLALDRQTDDNVSVISFHVHALNHSGIGEFRSRWSWAHLIRTLWSEE